MDKNFDKKMLITTIALCVLFLVVGFYRGRYYERNTARKRFAQMRNLNGGNMPQRNFMQNGAGQPGGPDGNRQMQFRDGQGGMRQGQ
jgi:hypothetical protein